jgi:hypothetical protein
LEIDGIPSNEESGGDFCRARIVTFLANKHPSFVKCAAGFGLLS